MKILSWLEKYTEITVWPKKSVEEFWHVFKFAFDSGFSPDFDWPRKNVYQKHN